MNSFEMYYSFYGRRWPNNRAEDVETLTEAAHENGTKRQSTTFCHGRLPLEP
jgi:hypothetical protein